MVLYLGEPPVMFLCCCYSFLMCIFICRCSSFCCYSSFISRLLYVTGTPPWLLRPMKASSSSELYPDYFWLLFLFHLPRALRIWVGAFYPQAFFIYAPSWHFWHNLLLSRLPWEPVVIPWNLQGFMLILETQTGSICLFDSQ